MSGQGESLEVFWMLGSLLVNVLDYALEKGFILKSRQEECFTGLSVAEV